MALTFNFASAKYLMYMDQGCWLTFLRKHRKHLKMYQVWLCSFLHSVHVKESWTLNLSRGQVRQGPYLPFEQRIHKRAQKKPVGQRKGTATWGLFWRPQACFWDADHMDWCATLAEWLTWSLWDRDCHGWEQRLQKHSYLSNTVHEFPRIEK
jgi:hypothetical protein